MRKALDQVGQDQQVACVEEALTALRVFGHDEPRPTVAAIIRTAARLCRASGSWPA